MEVARIRARERQREKEKKGETMRVRGFLC